MTESARLPVCVAALYRFAPFADPATLRDPLLALCERHGLRGTLLLAKEGINGTIAGDDEAIAAVIAAIRELPGCADLDVKYSRAAALPFGRMKVRLKREIVTMGQPEVDPLASVGTYVPPQDWNALISDPETIVIDTRNDYEVAIGRFRGALDPATASFRDFPAWFRRERERLLGGTGKPPKVAMYCTGGIRCEKSTAFLKAEGVEQVFHLQGGILRYLEEVPTEQSLWDGECFVFDARVAVGHGLAPGSHESCPDCGRAVQRSESVSTCPCHAAAVRAEPPL
ncbi:conserved hypothetical protein [Altererythrobacter sp. B11]|uniref:oxygen-dependent tRNA uridine(34) hydroxylase TrhO n=1 Tax=Altererythrobacter sp. B11 TaxID=2060312 RepID=UPI000DC6ED45|nr:rhodanese-related sulfurtransferase [Altererythrobacter sp. B11]BBC72372.1 conserved hypothetical protein [Altererythrobacter sp. B11]